MAGNLVITGRVKTPSAPGRGQLVEAVAYNDGVNGFVTATVAINGQIATGKVTYDDDEGDERSRPAHPHSRGDRVAIAARLTRRNGRRRYRGR